jgi:AAHS family 4-hydroxybenzoate transporter-like MFS transporter
MLATAAGAIASTFALSLVAMTPDASVIPLLALLTLAGALINAVQTTLYALAAHVYPTVLRARGVGTATAIGRSGAMLSGYAGPWVLERGGNAGFFGLMAAAMCVAFVGIALVRRHVPGHK